MITKLPSKLAALDPASHERVVEAVDLVLEEADRLRVSDVHFEPTYAALEVRFRIDGVLRPVASLPHAIAPNVIARLKVLAELLTYRTDIPQEGSIRDADAGPGLDRRVSTFPTVHGEKAVVRLFNPAPDLLDPIHLGLPSLVLEGLERLLQSRSGAVFLTGPSGSGKTTTIYACLRRLASDGGSRNIVTIEDPVERLIEGVTQSQAKPGTEFDFARGLRSLLRQDPEVIMVGEVRDRDTAAIAIEAALTGHLVFTTLHAGSACGVIGRLLEMGIEPHLLTSGIRGILNQRLLRRVCPGCGSAGCDQCGQVGYRGRMLVAEMVIPDADLRHKILSRADTADLEAVAAGSGWRPLRQAAADAVAAGLTTAAEVDRILGPA